MFFLNIIINTAYIYLPLLLISTIRRIFSHYARWWHYLECRERGASNRNIYIIVHVYHFDCYSVAFKIFGAEQNGSSVSYHHQQWKTMPDHHHCCCHQKTISLSFTTSTDERACWHLHKKCKCLQRNFLPQKLFFFQNSFTQKKDSLVLIYFWVLLLLLFEQWNEDLTKSVLFENKLFKRWLCSKKFCC